jgi:hypothetical protein
VTFLDLSDAEGMIGLYLELVADERTGCQDDPERLRFVEELLEQLKSMEANLDQVHLSATVQKLKDLHESADNDFANDPVMVHLNDLLEEIDKARKI